MPEIVAQTGHQREIQLKLTHMLGYGLAFREVVKHREHTEGMREVMVRHQVVILHNAMEQRVHLEVVLVDDLVVLEVLQDLRALKQERTHREPMVLDIDDLSEVGIEDHAVVVFLGVDVHGDAAGRVVLVGVALYHVQLEVALLQLHWV